ncbi:MAG: ImmA/IrrE family metallo-endopeptidase [Hyphomicrobiales bacterium]|nr:ImmA/IrrE family metallo-endopeptidase [Hyphomicrobiales bacterium]
MLNPSRLTIARQRAGLTKKELAVRVGVDPRAISGFEAGQYEPTEDNLVRLARGTGFPREFLEADDIEILSTAGVSFRSMSKMTAKQRDAAVAAGSIAFVLSDWVDREFDLPDVEIPDFSNADPEVAAESLRNHWGLGEQPIKNMVHLLESKGARVFSLAENAVEVDAYSLWRGRRPFVFLNTGKSGERRRFDAAHELAHLVLHRHGAPSGTEAEKEAHAFASAFLMPRASMRALGRVVPSFDYVIRQKARWLVSAAAMTTRLHALGMLTYYHYNRLFVELSGRGFRSGEPGGMKPETSQVWRKVFAALRSEGLGVQGLADKLLIPAEEIVKLVFGLVTIGLPPGDPKATTHPRGAHLTVIK